LVFFIIASALGENRSAIISTIYFLVDIIFPTVIYRLGEEAAVKKEL
jgi:hypothetical protein